MKLICLAAMLVLIACNKKEDKTTSTPVVADYGVYSACENGDDGTSAKIVVSYNQVSVVGSLTVFLATNCAAGNEILNERHIYSYTNTGVTYNLNVESVIITPLSSLGASTFNSESICSYGGWAVNTPKNIIGLDCEGYVANVGDVEPVSMYKSGTSLVMKDATGTTKYARVHGLDYANTTQTLSNGNYVYYDGTRAIYLTATSPNFTMYVYDEATHRYYVKTGTYTTSNNNVSFWATSNTPTCGSDVGTMINRKIATSAGTVAMEGLEGSDWILEKVNYTSTQFQNAYLIGSYTSQCF